MATRRWAAVYGKLSVCSARSQPVDGSRRCGSDNQYRGLAFCFYSSSAPMRGCSLYRQQSRMEHTHIPPLDVDRALKQIEIVSHDMQDS